MSVSSYTLNFAFSLIDYNSRGWHTEEYTNWQKLDSLLTSIVSNALPFVAATGAVNVFAATYNPVVAAYVSGLQLSFLSNLANTGACTLNVNGLGAKNIYRNGAALPSGAIPINSYVKVIYDGTQFQLLEPKDSTIVIPDGSVTVAKLSVGAATWDASGNVSVSGNETVSGNVVSTKLFEAAKRAFVQNDSTTFPSNKVTFSTADPSGGSDGDIWIKHA